MSRWQSADILRYCMSFPRARLTSIAVRLYSVVARIAQQCGRQRPQFLQMRHEPSATPPRNCGRLASAPIDCGMIVGVEAEPERSRRCPIQRRSKRRMRRRSEAAVRIGGLDHVVLAGRRPRSRDFVLSERSSACQVERELQQPRLVQLRAGASLIDLVPASVSPHEAPDKAGRNMDHFCGAGSGL